MPLSLLGNRIRTLEHAIIKGKTALLTAYQVMGLFSVLGFIWAFVFRTFFKKKKKKKKFSVLDETLN
jgi:predicted permease